jgi:hypothetical protein
MFIRGTPEGTKKEYGIFWRESRGDSLVTFIGDLWDTYVKSS